MALEPVQFLDDLVVTNPTDTDPVSEGDNHIRNLKIALDAAISADATDVRLLAGGGQVLSADVAEVRLLVGAVVKFLLNSSGVEITGFDLVLDNEVDAAASLKLINDQGGATISMRQSSNQGDLRIFEADALGVFVNDWMHFNKAGGMKSFFAGLQKLAVTNFGLEVRGSLDNDPATGGDQDGLIDFENQSGTRSGQLRSFLASLRLTNRTRAGFVHLEGVNSVSTLVQMLQGNPDGKVELRFNNGFAFETADPALSNSGANVIDALGAAQPVGYNVMPRIDVPAGSRPIAITDNGARLRFATSGADLTLANVASNMAFNIYVNTAGTTTITIPSGFTLRHYQGTQLVSTVGPATLNMNAGTTLTFIQFNSTIWEVWGSGLT